MVDLGLVEGIPEEVLSENKKSNIDEKVAKSIRHADWCPDLFREILQKVIGGLRGFIQYAKETCSIKEDAEGMLMLDHDLREDVTPDPLPDFARKERHDSYLQEAEVLHLENILKKLKKAEQRVYAIEKAKIHLEKQRKELDKKWFHGREKK